MPDKAEQQLRTILKQTPQFGPAWLALVELFIEQNRLGDATAIQNQLEGTTYRDSIMPALEARLALARNDIAGACAILEEGLVRVPNVIWLRMFLADLLLRMANNPAAAERHLRVVLELSPNDSQARLRLAQMQATRPA